MLTRIRSALLSPYVVMGAVIAMYVAKVIAKVAIGTRINSPMVAGDGYHNLSDIGEALIVIGVVVLARRRANEKYPFGRRNAESVFELAVGLLLGTMALRVALASLRGILEYLPPLREAVAGLVPLPEHHPLKMGPGYFWWVGGTMAVSIVLSALVSAYQIHAGRRSGHRSLVADGLETRSDGIVELTVLAGILGEYAFNAPWLEYPFGMGVAFFLARTGWGISSSGWRTLLQRSIGTDRESRIRALALGTHGIVGVTDLKTFTVGPMAICILKLVTRCGAQATLDIKAALAARIGAYLTGEGFAEWDYYIRFEEPEPARARIAYAVTGEASGDGTFAAAHPLSRATHCIVCDVEDRRILRAHVVPAPADPAALAALLRTKHVHELRAFSVEQTARSVLADAGIAYRDCTTRTISLS